MEKKTELKSATKDLVDKMKSGCIPLKWVGFHAGTGFPGAIADATTFSATKQKGLRMSFHPPSSLILIEIKDNGGLERAFLVHSTAAKGMEPDLSK